MEPLAKVPIRLYGIQHFSEKQIKNICCHCYKWYNERCSEITIDVHSIFPRCFFTKQVNIDGSLS